MINKEATSETPAMSRDKVIIRTSVIGIAANVLLAAFKAVIGLASNSIAVVLDAVNNLSDALSSIITIVGTKLAGKLPDKKHPLGYGRVEYLSAMLVSGIVLYAGIKDHPPREARLQRDLTGDHRCRGPCQNRARPLCKGTG